MKKIILIAVIACIGWYGNYLYSEYGSVLFGDSLTDSDRETELKCITKDGSVIYGKVPYGTLCERMEPIKGSLTIIPSATNGGKGDQWNPFFHSRGNEGKRATSFKCDGRVHCSQMTSCAEAAFFLRNCPNVKMDGNHDGIPCENQWCN
jgi:hypothetical protein